MIQDGALILVLAGIVVALFASRIDATAKKSPVFKYAMMGTIVALALFVAITLYKL